MLVANMLLKLAPRPAADRAAPGGRTQASMRTGVEILATGDGQLVEPPTTPHV